MGTRHESHNVVDLSGSTCPGRCKIHRGEKCTVVMRYNNPTLQTTLERLREATKDLIPHDMDGEEHWCELCSMALRKGRERDYFVRHPDGVIRTKHSPVILGTKFDGPLNPDD